MANQLLSSVFHWCHDSDMVWPTSASRQMWCKSQVGKFDSWHLLKPTPLNWSLCLTAWILKSCVGSTKDLVLTFTESINSRFEMLSCFRVQYWRYNASDCINVLCHVSYINHCCMVQLLTLLSHERFDALSAFASCVECLIWHFYLLSCCHVCLGSLF